MYVYFLYIQIYCSKEILNSWKLNTREGYHQKLSAMCAYKADRRLTINNNHSTLIEVALYEPLFGLLH